jgi:hypothetical protein
LAVFSNGGRMPVQGSFTWDDAHSSVTAGTKFRFLCDIYRIKSCRWSPICSIGDLFLWSGIFMALFSKIVFSS